MPRMEPHLINEVQCHSPLPYFHLFGFPVFSVLIPDFIYTLLQPPSCFVLLPVLLTLQGSWNRVSTTEQAELCSSNLRLKALQARVWQTISLYKSPEMLRLHSSASHCAATQLQVIQISMILNTSMEAARETHKRHIFPASQNTNGFLCFIQMAVMFFQLCN